jgi:uncharacterized repeat protein (TIGR04061 family)
MRLLSPAPARIDADLFKDLMSPDRLATYPRESRAFLRVDISIRAYWHTLFDTVPKLLELSGPDGQAIFLPFMDWARENKLSFDWTFFLWVYKWLTQSQFRDQLSEELMLSMMSASASRWLGYDRDVDALGVVLGSTALDGAVVGWKMNSVYCRLEQVERLTFEEPLPPPDDFFGYFVTPRFELDHFPGWRPLPL